MMSADKPGYDKKEANHAIPPVVPAIVQRGCRVGRRISSPPQFGQIPFKLSRVQRSQNVHSKEQIVASRESRGNATSQRPQLLFISNIASSPNAYRIYASRSLPLQRVHRLALYADANFPCG
jgi:hypothetical protein